MTISIGYSSEKYEILATDLLCLPDATLEIKNICSYSDEVVIYIAPNQSDCLVCGREKLLKNPDGFITVIVLFKNIIPSWNMLPLFIKELRYKYKYESSNSYHVKAKHLRELGIERGLRNYSNAYKLKNRRWRIPKEQRHELYNKLAQSIKNDGFDDNFPLSIMLCRRCGLFDCLDNGHHRLGICIEHDIEIISTNFIAAGFLSLRLQKFFRVIRQISNLKIKSFAAKKRLTMNGNN